MQERAEDFGSSSMSAWNAARTANRLPAMPRKNFARVPNVIRAGRLGSGTSYQNLLRSLATIPHVELGILHITVPGSSLQGDVAFASGTHIVGAATNQNTSGWSAMRTIFGLHTIEYKYLDYSGADIGSLDQGLEIKVSRVADALPCLPESPEELEGHNTLRLMREVNFDAIRAAQRAENSTIQALTKDIRRFEQESMKWRAIAMWALFAAIAIGTIAAHGMLVH